MHQKAKYAMSQRAWVRRDLHGLSAWSAPCLPPHTDISQPPCFRSELLGAGMNNQSASALTIRFLCIIKLHANTPFVTCTTSLHQRACTTCTGCSSRLPQVLHCKHAYMHICIHATTQMQAAEIHIIMYTCLVHKHDELFASHLTQMSHYLNMLIASC